MSEGAITSIVTGTVTIVTMVVGLLTLWIKLKYRVGIVEGLVGVVEDKVDDNTTKTKEAKKAAEQASEHSRACDDERMELMKGLTDHNNRIVSLESQMVVLKGSVESLSKAVDSTRHEMRGHLQTITNKLDIIQAKPAVIVNTTEPVKTTDVKALVNKAVDN